MHGFVPGLRGVSAPGALDSKFAHGLKEAEAASQGVGDALIRSALPGETARNAAYYRPVDDGHRHGAKSLRVPGITLSIAIEETSMKIAQVAPLYESVRPSCTAAPSVLYRTREESGGPNRAPHTDG